MAVFCEHVAGAAGNERWPVKIFSAAPVTVPPLLPNQVLAIEFDYYLFVSLAADGLAGQHRFETAFIGPEGEELAPRHRWDFDLTGREPGGVVYFDWRLRGKLRVLGTYWAEVRWGQQLLTRVPLTVFDRQSQ